MHAACSFRHSSFVCVATCDADCFLATPAKVLHLVVKRHNSEDVSDAMMARYSEKVREAGGVDAMLVVIGRYSDCHELFKLAYGVLNRLQRAVLTADILGEFVEARAHLQRVSADDPCNSHLLFPEQHEYTADPLKFLDSEHATALPHRGVPDAISGARPMIKGAGVHAAWSRNCCNSSKVLPRYLSDKVPDSRVQRLNPKP